MKVLLEFDTPFSLAHGGMTTLIEALMRELTELGIVVEHFRWWDAQQKGDVIHFFQRPSPMTVVLAKQKNYHLVMTEVIDTFASLPMTQLLIHRAAYNMLMRFIPTLRENRALYKEIDAVVYINRHELETAMRVYGLEAAKGHVIGVGLEPEVLAELASPAAKGDYLISLGTICERKNSILLAKAARIARVPVLFVGGPLAEHDPYYQSFIAHVDQNYVRFAGYVSEHEKRRLLRAARGFVLLSSGESGCIAVHEAAAAGLSLLLPDLKWVTRGYPKSSRILTTPLEKMAVVKKLRFLYDNPSVEKTPAIPLLTWRDIAMKYVDIYKKILIPHA